MHRNGDEALVIPSLPRSAASRYAIAGYVAAFFVFLFVPLVIVAVFAFNDANYPAPPWRGFTLDWFLGGGANRRVGLFADAPLLKSVATSVFVALWVLPRAIALARAALRILSESSPTHIDVEELRTALCAVDGVTEVHDLHVWTLVPGKDMVTAHLTSTADSAKVLDEAKAVLTARGLEHATVQVEPPDAAGDCNCEASW